MHTKVLAGHDLMTVGETPFTFSQDKLASYVLPASKELNMVFQFELMEIDSPHKEGELQESPHRSPEKLLWQPWRMDELKAVIQKWQACKREEGFWNACVLALFSANPSTKFRIRVYIENHDQARSVSRFGNDSPEWRAISAKLLTLLQITQTGTLYVYQGEELGLKNFPRSWGIEEYKDVKTINLYNS